MNLILFSRSSSAARHITFTAPVLGACSLVFMGLIAGAAGVGYKLAGASGNVQPVVAELQELRQTLQGERQKVAEIRQGAREQIDALTLYLGEMNANVIRLNALGRRLTGMAKLEEGEFDFDNAPAVGGPEEPLVSPVSGGIPDLMADIDTLDQSLSGQEQQLTTLEGLLLNRKLHQRVYPKGRPVRSGYLSSYFGKRVDPFTGKSAYHRGVDFAGKAGTEVITVAAGVVIWSGNRSGYGQMVEINHGNGYVTRYAHNERNLVAVGDYVRQGQTVALLGSSGRATGPNLHFEVWHHGRPVNPVAHLSQPT
jgi:murein DD-endopeptidase MepM/ murein hydrolase activator NlpD